MLRSRSSLSRAFIVAAALALTQTGFGAETQPDPAVTTYGTRNPAAPPELDTFAFLVGAVQGMSLRQFDAARQTWAIEFLNFNRSFLRTQVNAGTGGVMQEGNRITIAQPGIDGALGREVYTLVDADHFTYSLDFSNGGGATWESNVTIEMTREEAP